MVTVTKKHQTSMALIAVVLATAMIVGTFANSAFATGRHGNHFGFANDGKSATASQSISETCDQNQNSPVTTAGAISPPILSGIDLGLCVNANLGGNALNQDQSEQH